MAKTIPLSFRENKKDMELYNFLIEMDDSRSSYIRKAIRFYIEYEKDSKKLGTITNNNRNDDENDIGNILGI